ncbi:MAG: heparan N-sulfatase [Thalassobius sp.]|nr:heparan N-sulfatase [Thalassovita sp.]
MRINYFFSLILLASIALFSCSNPNNSAPQKPNILFAIADDATFMHMSAYGCTWVKTPAFDQVANNGLLFMNAYTPNAKCAPSRACIITGRNSWQLDEAGNHWAFFPPKFKSFPEALKENGYFTGYTAKGWAPGVALDESGNKRTLTGKAFNQIKTTPPAQHISDNNYAANFQAFLDSVPDNQPFCFWYGSIEPHRAYEFEAGIKKGGKKTSDIDSVPPFWPDNDSVRTDMLDYAFELEYFDKHLGEMLATLKERGELENTIVVVTSDNGMPFPRAKGQAYEYSNHLPLAIMWQNGIKNPSRKISDFVSFIDFAPTFLEAAGIANNQSGMQPITGKSLFSIFNSDEEGQIESDRNYVLIGKERHDIGRPKDAGYPIRGIVKDNLLYIHNFETDRWPAGNPETGYLNIDGSPTKSVLINNRNNKEYSEYWNLAMGKRIQEELYRLDEDAACMNNLSLNPEYTDIMQQLKNQLFEELKKQGDPRMLGKGEIFDNYTYADSSGVNFYERYMNGEKMKTGWVNDSDFEKNFSAVEN